MSWYNPLTWAGDAAYDTMERIGKAIKGMGQYAVEHPKETGAAVGVVLLSIAAVEGAKTGGRVLGTAGAKEIIKLNMEEYNVE